MFIKNKWWCIFFIALGAFILVLSADEFLVGKPTLDTGIMFLVGICWLVVGIGNLRRLQKAMPK